MTKYQILEKHISSNLKSTNQILNKYGFFINEPPKSYKAKQQTSDFGIKYWLSTSRNAKTRQIIFDSI